MILSWTETLQLVLSETEHIHRLYSKRDGWCYLSARNGHRFKIEEGMDVKAVDEIIQKVKRINDGEIY